LEWEHQQQRRVGMRLVESRLVMSILIQIQLETLNYEKIKLVAKKNNFDFKDIYFFHKKIISEIYHI
jgi:hypothetical protein